MQPSLTYPGIETLRDLSNTLWIGIAGCRVSHLMCKVLIFNFYIQTVVPVIVLNINIREMSGYLRLRLNGVSPTDHGERSSYSI